MDIVFDDSLAWRNLEESMPSSIKITPKMRTVNILGPKFKASRGRDGPREK